MVRYGLKLVDFCKWVAASRTRFSKLACAIVILVLFPNVIGTIVGVGLCQIIEAIGIAAKQAICLCFDALASGATALATHWRDLEAHLTTEIKNVMTFSNTRHQMSQVQTFPKTQANTDPPSTAQTSVLASFFEQIWFVFLMYVAVYIHWTGGGGVN